jgi:hypothetical protein
MAVPPRGSDGLCPSKTADEDDLFVLGDSTERLFVTDRFRL